MSCYYVRAINFLALHLAVHSLYEIFVIDALDATSTRAFQTNRTFAPGVCAASVKLVCSAESTENSAES